MSQSGQQDEPSGRAPATRGRGAKSQKSGKSNKSKDKPKDETATKSTGAGKSDGPERPGASGHRFGPDLACSECGILWDLHQREPKPCTTEVASDAFARRPAVGFDDKTQNTRNTQDASPSEASDGRASTASTDAHGSSDSAPKTTNND